MCSPGVTRVRSREIPQLTQEEFGAAFNDSPMKRAKRRDLQRNAAVVLGNVGTAEDVDMLTRALDDPDPLVREHTARALAVLGASAAPEPLRDRLRDELGDADRAELRSTLAGRGG